MLENQIKYLESLFQSYKLWVQKYPDTVSDVEVTSKWFSYFIAGKISESDVLAELIYSLSNILVLCNDIIISESKNGYPKTANQNVVHKVKLFLTTLEYSEVFIEFSARKSFGFKGKWLIIVAVQVIKTIGRFFLMKRSADNIIQIPPIAALDRKKFKQEKLLAGSAVVQNDSAPNDNTFTFKLKRSGKLVRKVEGAPPMHLRSNTPLFISELQPNSNLKSRAIVTAETIYISKPLIHLGAIGLFGYKSWKSYIIALIMDLISIQMFHKNRHVLTTKQKAELSKRCVNLFLYLARSPFYENQTEQRLENFLNGIRRKIPFTKTIMNHVIGLIPYYQESYFYMWSN